MDLTLLNLEQNNDLLFQSDVLAVFRNSDEKRDDIEQGMQPNEIAEITSDHFMAAVKEQFEKAKKEFESKPSS